MILARTLTAVVALLGATVGLVAAPAPAAAETLTIVTQEGTNFGAFVSRARDRMLINLQGVVWSLPMAGGPAQRLTDDLLEPVTLDWSPDGKSVVMQAYVDGAFHLWTLSADGKSRTQLTQGDFDDLEPRWSPDGKQILFVSDRAGNRDLWVMDAATRRERQITFGAGAKTGADVSAMAGSGAWISDPAWSPDGKSAVFIRNRTVEVIDLAGGQTRKLHTAKGFSITSPSWSPDGKSIAFQEDGGLYLIAAGGGQAQRLGDKTDVFPFAATWMSAGELLYTANGRIWRTKLDGTSREIPFSAVLKLERPTYKRKVYDFDAAAPQAVKGIVGPRISPDGRSTVFKALNDLWLLPIGGQAKRLTGDSYYEIDPAWSPDGRSIVYASDRGGTQDLYVREMATGLERRVTDSDGAEVAPAWSPDGKSIAFQTQGGDLNILDLAGGAVRTLAKGLVNPGRSNWSPDGRFLVLADLKDAKNRILVIDVASGAQTHFDPAPGMSISTRGDDGPVWTADGKALVFSMGSTIWRQPVTPEGKPVGAGQQLSDEASDAPSVSAAGDVLYLNNGRLRLIKAGGAGAQTVETGLNFRSAKPAQSVVIQAGRLWDGVHEAARDGVDILVVDNRIKEIGPRGAFDGRGAKVVDAKGLTVTPGMFDMHNHQQLRSKYLGDRQGRAWLAYGVTSTRSTGDAVYRALEDKEALESGDRVGPRHFMTGEMFEGTRVEWDFARPVYSQRQLELDLSRAEALGYDVIKTYVRFPFDSQAEVIDRAHSRMGISVTSHYLYPGVVHGQDGEEHLGGPTRWGFSEISSRGGLYQDVFETLTKTHFQITTTNFSAAAGLADEPALVADRRLKALYPPWELKDLEGKLACAQGRGPCGFLPPNDEWSKSTVQTMTRLLRGGASIMAGTDSPLDSYAISYQLNLRSMAKHGMTPFETLSIATTIPAKAQGVFADLGSVEAGKLADMVFVEGDPSKDIRDLSRVRMVMKNGRLFTVEELMAPFAAAAK
jgi:Tol biopolymer transport system component